MSFSVQTINKEWDYKMKKMVDKPRFNLKFIDSLQFMSSSLGNLVDNLKKSGIDKIKYTSEEFGDKTKIMIRKGIYPYSYMSSFKKFEVHPSKLRQRRFKNDLTGEDISEDDFKFYRKVCDKFNIKNLGDL